MALHGCVWLYMALYGCIWLYMTVYGCIYWSISLYMAVCGCIWLYMVHAGHLGYHFRNYLGIPGKSNIVAFQRNKYDGFESIKLYLQSMNFAYMVIFIITTSFAILSRIIGIFGLFSTIKSGNFFKPTNIFLVTILILFTAMYLYLGQSRFRVPLEPILMIYTVIGWRFIEEKILNTKSK